MIFLETLDQIDVGITVKGQIINNIRYDDDTVLIASTMEELQILTDKIQSDSSAYGFSINTRKTKYMTVCKTPPANPSLLCIGQPLQKVSKYLLANLVCWVDDT
ncbi:unnamed protein product [Parnassius apollo]|uniref:(apollo) hypothetical protein n=1 Tax=Parnassius apollo TaxID=110799 RepID=A0A8S3WWF7_PARAO|nr:unnamed protein product [Parnassius apollo]